MNRPSDQDIKKVVDTNYEILMYIDKNENLLTGGLQFYMTRLIRNCLKDYCKEFISGAKVKTIDFENFSESVARIDRRGSAPVISDSSEFFEIAIAPGNISPDNRPKESTNKNFRCSEYMSNRAFIEKDILFSIVKGIGKELLLGHTYCCEDFDICDENDMTIDLKDILFFTVLHEKALQFETVASANVRIWSPVKKEETV